MTEINFQENAFITKWRIIEGNKTLTLPLIWSGKYDFIVDWGDGTEEDHITTFEVSHIYPSEGIYQVSIIGTIKGWRATDTPGYKLLDVSQWGCLKLGNSGYYFYNCTEMDITAIDTPDLSETTNLEHMFTHCRKFNGKIGHWNVSRVTNMNSMFYDALSFNQPLAYDDGIWDVSSVTTMWNMFSGASSFNQDISQWNVSNVTTLGYMFGNASSFNQNISNWNVSNVINMAWMFYNASVFNQDISKWDVSHVTNMYNMFYNASLFNQPLASWNVSRVIDMRWMFNYALSFNQPISQWDVSCVTNMYGMFANSTAFINGPHLQDLDNWNLYRPDILANLLGGGKTIPLRPNRYLMNWDTWSNKHPTKVSNEYTCSICLTDLPTDETWRTISCPSTINQCIPHCFHKECIEGWIKIKNEECYTCPVCRRNAIAIK